MQNDFNIGEWLIQARLNVIKNRGKSTRVKPRSMAVLVCLAQARGEVVEKNELMEAVWGQSIVTEDVLTQSIVELRKAFGDRANKPKVIETIRRVGFRLLPSVTPARAASQASFFSELNRRNVVKVAVAYFIVGWLLVEIASVFLPTFEAPGWIMKVFTFLVILGFPMALIFAWAFEMTPEGIKRETDLEREHGNLHRAAWGGLAALLILVAAAAVYGPRWRQAVFTTAHNDPSVAVLPFINLSDKADTDFFSDGLSEEVLNTLTLIPGLRVPARTSSFAFRDRDEDVRVIGRNLNVATVLEGSVRRSGRQIRVTAQLIDVESGYHIWSQTYNRQLADVFAVQTDIARSIADELKVKLGGEEEQSLHQAGTANADAYELYLLGRHHLDSELGDWIVNARRAFGQAIAVDPQFARAHAGLADTYLVYRETPGSFLQGDATPFDEALAEAQRAIDRALELEPALADPYVSRAAVAAARSDWLSEEQDLRIAIDLNPSLVRAFLRLGANLLAQGRPGEAHEAYLKAASLDPLNPQVAASLARLTAALGDYDTAISFPLRLLESGLRSPLSLEALVNVNRAYGRFVERVRWARELVRLAPTRAAALAELADAYIELGEFDLAEKWASRAQNLSALQALKVRSRLYAVRKDMVGLKRLIDSAIQSDPPQSGIRLSPAQSVIVAISGITYILTSDYHRAVESFERVFKESSTLHRRSPEMPLVATNWLARSYLGASEVEKAEAVLISASALAQEALDKGFGQYPPLLWEIAVIHALSGRGDAALSTWQDAIALGWRHYYIQGREYNPLRHAYEDDARFEESSRQLEAEIAIMRDKVRANGWAESPEEFFARDQLKVTGAR